jgi:stage V sporulation protein SpoVS
MILRFICVLSAFSCLTSCDRIRKVAAAVRTSGSMADQVKISSGSKPEIVAAFEAISLAAREHNRVLIQHIGGNGPVNEPAFSAGINHLGRSSLKHTGLAKQIIDAVITTSVYEKTLFVPFDTTRRQAGGMETWSTSQALQRRGYIQIMDQEVLTYNEAITYLERGEEPLLRRNFDQKGVPREVADEFLRLQRLWGKEIRESELGMFREQRATLQCYRDALAAASPAKANELNARAGQHSLKAKDFENKMVSAIRKQLDASALP